MRVVGVGNRDEQGDQVRIRSLAALADPDRRRAVELLGQRPRRAGELAEALKLPAPAGPRPSRMSPSCRRTATLW